MKSDKFVASVLITMFLLGTAIAARATLDNKATANRTVEEVIVQARRRDEKLIDVPLAETVQSSAQLQEQNAILFEDATRTAPNVLAFKSARSVSALEVTMRGQAAIPSSIVYDPAVGLYIDGIYVANGQGAMGTLLDIDSVEIVRGAQGTLFGRNNTGGSISLHTHRPELDTYSAELSVSGGNQQLFGDRAIVNLPLGDKLALRVAYQSNQHEGWGSSIATGQNNFMNQHREQMRFGALLHPDNGIEAYFTYERFLANEVGALLHPLPGTLTSTLPGNIVPANFYQTDTGRRQNDSAYSNAYQLTLSKTFAENYSAKLILGYRELAATNDYDADAFASSLADVTLSNTSRQRSAELQVSGNALASKLDWVSGVYWFKDSGSADSNLLPGYSAPVPTIETNSVVNRSTAGFFHGEYHFTERWSFAAGIRRTEDTRSLDDTAYLDQTPATPAQFCTIVDASDPSNPIAVGSETGGACPSFYRAVQYSYWSWEFSTRYRFSDNMMAYLRNGRAQRSGGWNVPLNTVQDKPFRPEQLTDYEIGLKAQSDDARLSANTALFTGDYTNMQRLLGELIGGTPTTIVINAGSARVSGLEFEGNWQVNEPFTVRGAFGWTDAKYLHFIDTAGNDASHNDFYMTPAYEWNVSGIYDLPLASGDMRLRADYAWRDRIEFNVINDNNYQPAVGIVNAHASFTPRDSNFEIALFGTNLTDKQYAYAGGTILFGGQPAFSWQAAADRRLYGIELTYQFRAQR